MKRLTQLSLVTVAAGGLIGCAQPSPRQHGMMMGQMPMMGSPGQMSPEAKEMMASCMQHMQAMSAPRNPAASESRTR